jgi:hypothetical protein
MSSNNNLRQHEIYQHLKSVHLGKIKISGNDYFVQICSFALLSLVANIFERTLHLLLKFNFRIKSKPIKQASREVFQIFMKMFNSHKEE